MINLFLLSIIFSGGIAEEVEEKILHSAFIPFGDIIDIQIPLDYETNKHRGFAFLEYELNEDAAAAIDNMNESELYGKTIRVNIAKPQKNKTSSRALWNSDEWLLENTGPENQVVEKESGEGTKVNAAGDEVWECY